MKTCIIVSSFRQEACDVEVLLQLPYRVCFRKVCGPVGRFIMFWGAFHRKIRQGRGEFWPFLLREFFVPRSVHSWHRNCSQGASLQTKNLSLNSFFWGWVALTKTAKLLRIKFCGGWICGSEILNFKGWFKGNQYALDIPPPLMMPVTTRCFSSLVGESL